VPDFCEIEVDKCFLHFEKVAKNLKWLEDNQVLLLQSSLVGKVREVYALSVDDSSQHEIVQNALKAYELVLKAYRQKFCNTVNSFDETHVEFDRHKENLFDR